jgi:hypothetical protein
VDGKQRELFEDEQQRTERRGLDLLRAMRDTKERITSKAFAYFIGKKEPSEVDNALSLRDRKVPALLSWVLALIEADPERYLLRWLADQVGCDVVPKRRLTDGEKFEALKQATLHELGPTMGPVLLRRAGVEQ